MAAPAVAAAFLLACASAQAAPTVPCAAGGGGLVSAINAADHNTGPKTITLAPGCTYDLSAPADYWYGPDGLPAISTTIVIKGNGATISRSGNTPFRFFYIGADPNASLTFHYFTPGAGNLTLENLTLTGGLAKGGNGGQTDQGGGGGGMGGAIFNQGTLTLVGVTISGNKAQGGDGGAAANGVGGGGIGTDAPSTGGGGMAPTLEFVGAPAATNGGTNAGGGGSGFASGETGQNAFTGGNCTAGGCGGAGGGPATGLGGVGGGYLAGIQAGISTGQSGDGAGGGGLALAAGSSGGAGGGVGSGGGAGTSSAGGGGGGVGGGGGGGSAGGGGGFGGGGGGGANFFGGFGGFGGGGGGDGNTGDNTNSASGRPGFGGGRGNSSGAPGGEGAGGGAGLGGAVFNMQGTVHVVNSTLSGNTAVGGNGSGGGGAGSGFGGAIFNLNGAVTVTNATIASNIVSGTSDLGHSPSNAGGIYNLGANAIAAVHATVTLKNTILAYTPGGLPDLYDAAPPYSGTSTSPNNQATASTDATSADIIVALDSGDTNLTGNPSTADPKLGPLQFNGGPGMFTRLPGATSSAINHGVSTGAPSSDERAVKRPQGAIFDIGAVEYSLPLNLTRPKISGTPRPGLKLTCVNASWRTREGPTSFAYRWRANGALIAGATHNTFVPGPAQEGKSITCQVTATNAAGSTTVGSPAVKVNAPPKCTLKPVSTTVLLAKSRTSRTQPGTLTFTVTCDQSAKLTLSGTLVEKLSGGSFTTFVVQPVHGSCAKGAPKRLTLKLPSGALKALKQHKTLSGKFKLTARAASGLTSHVFKTVPAIRGKG